MVTTSEIGTLASAARKTLRTAGASSWGSRSLRTARVIIGDGLGLWL